MAITIQAKIGTGTVKIMRVKSRREPPKKGEAIKAMKQSDFDTLIYKANKWQVYKVDDVNGNLYYISLY